MRTSDVETFLLESERNVSERRKNVSTIASNAAIEIARGRASALTRKLHNRSRRLLLLRIQRAPLLSANEPFWKYFYLGVAAHPRLSFN